MLFVQLLLSSLVIIYGIMGWPSESGLCDVDQSAMAESMGSSTINVGQRPFTVSVSKSTFAQGEVLKVNITVAPEYETQSFKGLLLYATAAAGTQKGKHQGRWITFDSSLYKTLDDKCQTDKATLSHSSRQGKKTAMFEWQAPSVSSISSVSTVLGNVEFRGMIVGKNMQDWIIIDPILVNYESSSVQVEPSQGYISAPQFIVSLLALILVTMI